MVTLDLVLFIKNELQKKTSKEYLKSILKEKGGWRNSDIEDGFLLAEYGYQTEDEKESV
jgi:hypothetical protein